MCSVVGQSDYYGNTNRQAIKPGTETVKRKPKRNTCTVDSLTFIPPFSPGAAVGPYRTSIKYTWTDIALISSSVGLLPRPPSSFCQKQYEKLVEVLSHIWMRRASLAFAIPAIVQVAHVQFKTPIYLLLTSLIKQKYQPLRISFNTTCNQQLEAGVTNK